MMPITDDVVEQFKDLPAATIFEGAGKSGGMSCKIRPLSDEMTLAGRAYTVRCFPGDLSAMMRAVDEANPGDVLVIETTQPMMTTWGGSGTTAAVFRKLGGVVTNGCARDVAQIRRLNFPVFSQGISVRGGVRKHPGWTAIPVSVGGVVVETGDIVIGDVDGVVVVPRAGELEILERSLERRQHELRAETALGGGTPYSEWTGVVMNKNSN